MRILVTLLLIFGLFSAKAQKQKTYYNQNMAPVPKAEAHYYSEFRPSAKNLSSGTKEIFLLTGEKVEETEYADVNRLWKSGKSTRFFEDGTIEWEANYNASGRKHGDFKLFDRNGNLIRQEKWENGELTEGKCFDASGNEIEFQKYEIFPSYLPNNQTLINNFNKLIKPPRNTEIVSEKVLIGFTVNELGQVLDPHIINPSLTEFEDIALNAFIKANQNYWKPGIRNGKPDKFYLTMPAQFRRQ